MSIRQRKIAAALAAAGIVACFSACGGGNTPAATTANTGINEAAKTVADEIAKGNPESATNPIETAADSSSETSGANTGDYKSQYEVIEPDISEIEYTINQKTFESINIKNYTGKANAIKYPSVIDGMPVKSVGINPEKSDVEYLVIPDGVERIGNIGFELKYIDIPDSVIGFGEKSFFNASSLEEIIVPGGVEEIVNNAFYNCRSLKKIVLSEGVKSIGEFAFDGCSSMESISLPDSLEKIGNNAFWDCSSLKEITIPDSVTDLGRKLFMNCKSLEKITFPKGMKSIPSECLLSCYGLKEIIITNEEAILYGDYKDSPELETVVFKGKTISGFAFADCKSLKNVKSLENVTLIGEEAFRNCTALTELELPDTIETIGNDAFVGCDALTVTYKGEKYTKSNFDELYKLFK